MNNQKINEVKEQIQMELCRLLGGKGNFGDEMLNKVNEIINRNLNKLKK
tara:strand:- start:807 stop:953 length:147 start_codon:yes stop_codon:yes gene_type:complete